jgi:preprotein translocase subunit SecD
MLVMVVLSLGGTLLALGTGTRPVLGLDLQGGFSVVLQAREVDGVLPSEESVEKAKDIIRQRVDGLGVAEPDITRQGRTVVVQLPGVRNRQQAESVVGCTAKLEFRPVISVVPNPDAPVPDDLVDVDIPTTTEATDGSTTTGIDGEAPPATGSDTTAPAPGETSGGSAGAAPGDGALPAQFAPTTVATTTTTIPEPPSTTAPVTTTPESTTTVPGEPTSTTVPADAGGGEGSGSACGSTGENALPIDPAEGLPEGSVRLYSEDRQFIYTLGPVGLEGDALNEATATLNNGQWQVVTSVRSEFSDQGTALFDGCYNAEPACPSQAVAIVLDGVVLSAPQVQGPGLATSDSFQITGEFTEGEAKELALVLRYGALPVEFEQVALQQVSATLGSDSLRAGLIAGGIGIAALALYMVLYYRGFGLVVVVSLTIWAALMYGIICLLSETQGLALTLAGITGIIVSVGTTVDTYVVVFERVKDQVRAGRSIRRATELGYQQGIRTVLTANGAAFIGAFLLWYLTIGPVRGFAYFLGISVIVDLLVAIAFTRPMMLLLARSPRFARAKFFGLGAEPAAGRSGAVAS